MNKLSRLFPSSVVFRPDAFILAFGIVLRFLWWAFPNYNMDVDLLKAGLNQNGFADLVFGTIGYGQSAPLGFILVAKSLLSAGISGDRALAAPLLAISVATLFLWRQTLKATGVKNRVAYNLALFLFAAHPQLIAYSGFLKPYGIDAFFATALLYFAASEKTDRQSERRFVLCAAFAPWFSTGSFFVLPAVFAARFFAGFGRATGNALPVRLQRAILPLVRPAAIVALSSGISFAHLIHSMPPVMLEYWADDFAPVSLSREAATWWWLKSVRLFRGPVFFSWVFYFPSWLQVGSATIPAMLFLLGIRHGGRAGKAACVMAFLTASAVFLASAVGRWPIRSGTVGGARLLMCLIPSMTLVLVFGVAELFGHWPKSAFVLVPVVVASVLEPVGFREKMDESWNPSTMIRFVREQCPPETEFFGTDLAKLFFSANIPEWMKSRENDWNLLGDGVENPPVPSGEHPVAVMLTRHHYAACDDYRATLLKHWTPDRFREIRTGPFSLIYLKPLSDEPR